MQFQLFLFIIAEIFIYEKIQNTAYLFVRRFCICLQAGNCAPPNSRMTKWSQAKLIEVRRRVVLTRANTKRCS